VDKEKSRKVSLRYFLPANHCAYLRHRFFSPVPCAASNMPISKEQEPGIRSTNHNPDIAAYNDVDGVPSEDWYASIALCPGMYLNNFRDMQIINTPNTLDLRKRWHVAYIPAISDSQSNGWNEVFWRSGNLPEQIKIRSSTGRGADFDFFNTLSVDGRIILMAKGRGNDKKPCSGDESPTRAVVCKSLPENATLRFEGNNNGGQRTFKAGELIKKVWLSHKTLRLGEPLFTTLRIFQTITMEGSELHHTSEGNRSGKLCTNDLTMSISTRSFCRKCGSTSRGNSDTKTKLEG